MLLNIKEEPVDLRIRRTRMLVHQAFVELLGEKNFRSITVQEIADRAMVNRATFYDHFADKYELLEYTVRAQFRETLESKLPENFTYCAGNLQFLIATVCEFINQMDSRCQATDKALLPSFDEQITKLVSEVLIGWLTASADADPALTASVVSWGILGAARHWSRGKKGQEDASAFAQRIAPTFTALLMK